MLFLKILAPLKALPHLTKPQKCSVSKKFRFRLFAAVWGLGIHIKH
jgi:hypothetical protein